MDDFVRGKLTEWGLEEYISVFEENEVKEDNFIYLNNELIKELIPKVGPRAKFIKCLEELKEEQERGEDDEEKPSTSAIPNVTPGTSAAPSAGDPSRRVLGERKLDYSERGPGHRREKRLKLEQKLKTVKDIMNRVKDKLPDGDNDEIIAFLRGLILNLKMDKKEQVGVFGKTGAGKSSLINALIGEEKLLPTGVGRACTSVITKVEGNTENLKYVGNVEFISEQELEDLVESMEHLFLNSSGKIKEADEESKDSYEKMAALFGTNWNEVSYETFKKSEKYMEMTNTIQRPKPLTCDSASELSEILSNYLQNVRNPSGPLYWPVVKCVTIKVPDNDLLHHVTLVDLPGTGDRNKTRNDLWKETVSSCGTVWIVTEVKRPISEREPWEILQRACSLLGNGGECRNIHFICTQADLYKDELKPAEIKKDVIQEFQTLQEVQNHFPQDCFCVFIVSAKDEQMPENEISDLDEFLQSLNDREELVQRYVADAFAILALMKGARSENTDQKELVLGRLCAKREEQLEKIEKSMRTAYESLDKSLTQGVKKAKQQWETAFDKKIGSETHYKKLRSILLNNGVQQTTAKGQINLNTTLSSVLASNIDRQFLKTFPNKGKVGPFYGAIGDFSLSPESLIEKNKGVELELKFLKREEEKMKVKLCEVIRQRKKWVYNSLTETVTSEMLDAYIEAEGKRGIGAVEDMKQTLKNHIRTNNMFDKAREEMLQRLQTLMEAVNKTIRTDLNKMMTMSLKKDMTCVPDVTQEFTEVETLQ